LLHDLPWSANQESQPQKSVRKDTYPKGTAGTVSFLQFSTKWSQTTQRPSIESASDNMAALLSANPTKSSSKRSSK
jgi:hypothetical protein